MSGADRAASSAIRLASADDLDAIVRVERAANSLYAAYGLAEHLEALVTPRELVLRGMGEGLAWVAGEGGAIEGFALAHQAGHDLHLDELDVVPSRQRRGLGSRLLETVLAEGRARGARRLTLVTVDFVPWTLGFYAHHGFRALSAAELDARLSDELSIARDACAPTQRSFEGRIVLARNAQAAAASQR